MTSPYRIVLQARTTSTRLPGKALLPLAGIPSALLVAQRAARNGDDLVLATSEDPSDDYLAKIFQQAGIEVVRGPLDDVLRRFVMATDDLEPEELCVRITADNPFPDADFIHAVAEKFEQQGLDYASAEMFSDWTLPYGLSAEIFTVNRLRLTHEEAQFIGDREHVTPLMRKGFRSDLKVPPESGPGSLPRCTMDTIGDYLTLLQFFETVDDPIMTPWQELVEEFASHVQDARDRFRS